MPPHQTPQHSTPGTPHRRARLHVVLNRRLQAEDQLLRQAPRKLSQQGPLQLWLGQQAGQLYEVRQAVGAAVLLAQVRVLQQSCIGGALCQRCGAQTPAVRQAKRGRPRLKWLHVSM